MYFESAQVEFILQLIENNFRQMGTCYFHPHDVHSLQVYTLYICTFVHLYILYIRIVMKIMFSTNNVFSVVKYFFICSMLVKLIFLYFYIKQQTVAFYSVNIFYVAKKNFFFLRVKNYFTKKMLLNTRDRERKSEKMRRRKR